MPSVFMSSAPRPQMVPSWRRPENGGTFQRVGSAGTTSMWFIRMSGRSRPDPGSVASRLARPGANSSISTAMPSRSRTSLKKSAPFISFPGGTVVSIRR